MIYTVTFNPAIDYVVHMDEISLGETNRTSKEEIYYGGKGINVSSVLKELDIQSKALGFIAGFTGQAIEEGLLKKGIDADFVKLSSGFSRINVKIKSQKETELNAQGPLITEADLQKLYEKLDLIQDDDILVLAGSIPNTLPSKIYEDILEYLKEKKIKVVVDATKELLLNVLKYKPFLVKPNKEELGELFKVTINNSEDIIYYAKKLKEMGALNVIVSMASEGAILVDETGKIHSCDVCKGTVKNSVGAGDSMVAGFIAGSMDGNYEYALKLATATGGATAFSNDLATKEEIYKMLDQLL